MGTSAIFLDRDGVINRRIDGGTVTSWELFRFLPGALDGIRQLTALGVPLFVVTNQACIGRALLSEEALETIHRRMCETIRAHGGEIRQVYVCPHRRGDGCDCRKPRPGLLERAAREHGVELARSWIVGDSAVDVLAGDRVGCRTILVRDRRYAQMTKTLREHGVRPTATARSLLDAADLIHRKMTPNASEPDIGSFRNR